jgi:hypothetical protein
MKIPKKSFGISGNPGQKITSLIKNDWGRGLMREPVGRLLKEDIWRYCSGRGSMAALGMSGYVDWLLEEDIWRYCSGRGSMAALGMSGYVDWLLEEDICMCCSGRGSMATRDNKTMQQSSMYLYKRFTQKRA